MAEPTDTAEPIGAAELAAWQRLVVALRAAISHVVQLDAPLAVLESVSAKVEAIVATLAPLSGVKAVPRFQKFDPACPSDCLPYSAVGGKLNPLAPPVAFSVENGRMIARVTLGSAYEGGVGFAHGGVVAMIWDEVLALANVLAGESGPTGELRVRYLAPTPVAQELRFEAWHERREGRRIVSLGRCYAGDVVVSEAEGVFIALDLSASKRTGWSAQTQGVGVRGERRRVRGPV